jgi:hypothetical protein
MEIIAALVFKRVPNQNLAFIYRKYGNYIDI